MKTLKKITAMMLIVASICSTSVFASRNVTIDAFENDVYDVVRGLTAEEARDFHQFQDKNQSSFGYAFMNKVTTTMDSHFGTGKPQILMNGIFDAVNDIDYSLTDGAWVSCWHSDGKALMIIPERTSYKYYEIKLKKPTEITVFLNGKKLEFDQKPITDNDRTLVPLRKIFEELGATVEWDDATQTATAKKGKTFIQLTVGQTTAYKNRAPIVIDVPAKEINGRILVPVRFIAGCFGVKTDWDEGLQKVTLTSTKTLENN